MKLYFPAASTGSTLASLWSLASYPIASDATNKAWLAQLVDNQGLPFYLLQTYPVANRGTLRFTGTCNITPTAGTLRDYCYKQLGVFGVQLSGSGTIPYAWVFANSWLATSAYATMSFGSSGIQGVAFFPAFVYIYRPSTQSVVGTLASPLSSGRWSDMVYNCTSYVRAAGAGGTGPGNGWYAFFSEYQKSLDYTRQNVDFQNGDYLCYEMWGCSYTSARTGTMSWIVDFDVGWNGGVSTDQPWGTNTALNHNGNCFFYWDDLSAPVGVPVTGLPYSSSPVTLTNVDPSSGPKVRLTFDNPVTAGGDATTIGPASSGLGVTEVEQIDDVTVDLHTDYPPAHPLGEAESLPSTPDNVRRW